MRTSQQRRRMALAAVFVTLAVVLATFAARKKTAPAAALSATELVQRAATNFTTVRALHFTLTSRPAAPGLRLAGVTSGDGDVVWPDQLVFRGILQSTPTLAVPVVIAMCGPDRYVEMGDGNFLKLAALPNVHHLLFAPDTGLVASVLTQLEQLSPPEAATVEKVPAWHVAGTVPPRLLTNLPGRAAPSITPVRAELWIGQQDLQLRQVTLNGPMFDGDSAQTTRTLTFSRFNEHLPLAVPRGRLPCGVQS